MDPFTDIQVALDSVTISNQTINRPEKVSRSEWVDFWERLREQPNRVTCEECGSDVWIG